MQIKERVNLESYNTFRIGVITEYLIPIKKEEELEEAFRFIGTRNKPYFVLGGGSNVLFTGNYPGIILLMEIKGLITTETPDFYLVKAGAGEKWQDLVEYCLQHQIPGLENLSLIPGTVGAAPVQNIGAYGVELKDHFSQLRAYEISSGTFKWISREECQFGYRSSVFKTVKKGEYIITEVEFQFPKKALLQLHYGQIKEELEKESIWEPRIQDISRVVSRIRVEKLPDPKTIGNAGSFFKNPLVDKPTLDKILVDYPDLVYFPAGEEYKLAAGWMIEKCGWKGKGNDKVGTWKNQALVLVNKGGADGKDILDFSRTIIDSVFSRFGVRLEPEVNIVTGKE